MLSVRTQALRIGAQPQTLLLEVADCRARDEPRDSLEFQDDCHVLVWRLAGTCVQTYFKPYAMEILGAKIRTFEMIGLGRLPLMPNRKSSQT